MLVKKDSYNFELRTMGIHEDIIKNNIPRGSLGGEDLMAEDHDLIQHYPKAEKLRQKILTE